jgi:hypothetical protein
VSSKLAAAAAALAFVSACSPQPERLRLEGRTLTINTFVAGFGQRFPPRQDVTGVEVTATDSAGDAIRLVWGKGRRR